MNTDYVYPLLAIFAVLYSSTSMPVPPQLDNLYVKLAIMALIVYLLQKDMKSGILLALIFVLSIIRINEQYITEGFLTGIEDGRIEDGTWEGGDDQKPVSEKELLVAGKDTNCMQ